MEVFEGLFSSRFIIGSHWVVFCFGGGAADLFLALVVVLTQWKW
jgi:hypothetical protein